MTAIQHRNSVLGEDADSFRESVHAYVRSRSPEPTVRRLMVTVEGFDSQIWTEMATQLELPAMSIPERFGGSGFSMDAQAVVFEEMGAALMCTPYLSNFLACEALIASGDEDACAELLPAIAAGRTRASVAVDEPDHTTAAEPLATLVDRSSRDGEARIYGVIPSVIDGASAHLLVISARTDSGPAIFAIQAEAAEVIREPVSTLDLTRKQARLVLDGASGRLIAKGRDVGVVSATVRNRAAIALSAENVGCAERCLEMSVEHAKDRVQFGHPIGSFQAIKHKCAEMFRLLELARAGAYEAALAATKEQADAATVASIAKVYSGEAAQWIAAENIHVHGGMGYTWEHPAHLYFRRAASNRQLFGGAAEHRSAVLRALGL